MSVTGEDGLTPLPESRLVDEVVGPVIQEATEAFLQTLDGITIDVAPHAQIHRDEFTRDRRAVLDDRFHDLGMSYW